MQKTKKQKRIKHTVLVWVFKQSNDIFFQCTAKVSKTRTEICKTKQQQNAYI